MNYIATSSSTILRKTALDALEHYGCGSCGPRGFYGTIDAHLEAEEVMSNFLGTEGAILYSDGVYIRLIVKKLWGHIKNITDNNEVL